MCALILCGDYCRKGATSLDLVGPRVVAWSVLKTYDARRLSNSNPIADPGP